MLLPHSLPTSYLALSTISHTSVVVDWFGRYLRFCLLEFDKKAIWILSEFRDLSFWICGPCFLIILEYIDMYKRIPWKFLGSMVSCLLFFNFSYSDFHFSLFWSFPLSISIPLIQHLLNHIHTHTHNITQTLRRTHTHTITQTHIHKETPRRTHIHTDS